MSLLGETRSRRSLYIKEKRQFQISTASNCSHIAQNKYVKAAAFSTNKSVSVLVSRRLFFRTLTFGSARALALGGVEGEPAGAGHLDGVLLVVEADVELATAAGVGEAALALADEGLVRRVLLGARVLAMAAALPEGLFGALAVALAFGFFRFGFLVVLSSVLPELLLEVSLEELYQVVFTPVVADFLDEGVEEGVVGVEIYNFALGHFRWKNEEEKAADQKCLK